MADKRLINAAETKQVGAALGINFPDYYTRLDKLEAEADTYWASRR
jgi:hypothetical protein